MSLTSKKFDQNHMGPEPEIDSTATYSSSELIMFFNWYNYMFDHSEARQFIKQYAMTEEKWSDKIAQIDSAPTYEVSLTAAWLVRMMSRGLKVSIQQKTFIAERIQHLVDKAPVQYTAAATDTKSVAERVQDKARELIGDVEGVIDDFVSAGYKNEGDIYVQFVNLGIKGAHKKVIIDHLKEQQKQIAYAAKHFDNKEDPIVEGYLTVGVRNLRRMNEFFDAMIDAVDTIAGNARQSRKPRAKKVKTAKKQVSKIKYMAKDDSRQLVSVNPEKLIGAKAAFVLNTSNNQLSMYIADTSDGFTVERSSLKQFKSSSSSKRVGRQMKTLTRLKDYKRDEAINAFDKIPGTGKPATGRFNDKMIILKVYN